MLLKGIWDSNEYPACFIQAARTLRGVRAMIALDAIFDGWAGALRILVSVPILYVSVILFVRLTGKRATSQMNNFDWIVTVAIGSIIGSGALLDDTSIVDTLLAIGLFLLLQWLLTRGVLESALLRRAVKAEPRLLVHKGRWLEKALTAERIAKAEVMSAIRAHGLTSLDEVQWVILETNAKFSVIPRDGRDFTDVEMQGVLGFPPPKTRAAASPGRD